MFHLLLAGLCFGVGGDVVRSFAPFDGLTEGFYGQTLVDGGITFFGVDHHLPFPGGILAVDDIRITAAQMPEWVPYFSPPNVLAMTAFGGGPRGGGARFGELRMTTGRVENFASVDVFHFDTTLELGNSIVLEAYLGGRLVANDIAFLSLENGVARVDEMTITGVPFDVLRLTADGPGERPYFRGSIDNVRIVPEPSTLLLLIAAGAATLRQRSAAQA